MTVQVSDPAPVRVVHEGPVPEASCPHCGGKLQLSAVGTRWKVRWPSDVADRLMLQLGGLEREELHVLLLNTRHVVIDQVRVYQGNIAGSVVRIAELFTEAVRHHARTIVLVHNHPSGDPTPSPEDLQLTAEAVAAGRLLDVRVLDHIVIGCDGFVSLRERGVAFEPNEAHSARDQEDPRSATWNVGTRACEPSGEVAFLSPEPRPQSRSNLVHIGTHPASDPRIEVVGPDWLPCLCTHGGPVHRTSDSGELADCLAPACFCPVYTPAKSALEALAAPAYSQAWEPLQRGSAGV
jgi:RadC-like JAB domain